MADGDVQMPLTAHLRELRTRLIRSLLAIAVGFGVCYGFAEPLIDLLKRPLFELTGELSKVTLIGTGVAEAFFFKLKVAFFGGVFLAVPVILYEIWQFVVPALYESERRHARPFVFFGTIFFLLGAAFCYEVALPYGYRYFIEQYTSIDVSPQIKITEYLSFTSRMVMSFGAVFELPVVTFFLARIGVVDHRTLIRQGRYAVVIIFIVAAVLTPSPDVASQMMMAAPLLVLYVLSIGVAYFCAKPAKVAEEQAPEDQPPLAPTA